MTQNTTIYAESVNYFQSSTTAADTWIDRAKKEIASIGGKILGEHYGADASGRSAFRLDFKIGNDTFKVIWAVLPSKTKKDKAAKIQAATLLYHDVKHKVVMAKIKGVRTAFLEYLCLPDGKTVGDAAGDSEAWQAYIPQLMLGSGR